jgi:acetoin utilization deacetylase AcuC-like enzyme
MERVAIIDYDVHHGNGTQWMFYDDPKVLYVSTHQYPFYPGTGAASDVGRGNGAGLTFNVPLEAGSTDGDYDEVFEALVIPVIDQFRPELLLISAGFDAHERDPLARMRLSTAGYAGLTKLLCDAADRHCHGRIVAVTEGGYDLAALKACLDSTIAVLDGAQPAAATRASATQRSRMAIAQVRSAQSKYWKL